MNEQEAKGQNDQETQSVSRVWAGADREGQGAEVRLTVEIQGEKTLKQVESPEQGISWSSSS